MDFIRKNWSRLSLSLLFFVGGVLSVVAWLNSGRLSVEGVSGLTRFYDTALLISTLVFFFGMVGVTILKSIPGSKKVISCVYMAMGGVVTLLNVILLIVICCNDANQISLVGPDAVHVFCEFITPTLVFGLHPLIKGVTRFIECEETPVFTAAPVKAAAPVKQQPVAKAQPVKAAVKPAPVAEEETEDTEAVAEEKTAPAPKPAPKKTGTKPAAK